MKRRRLSPLDIQPFLLLCASAVLAAGTAADLFQEGLTQETAAGDLEGAIAIYRQIVAQHPGDGPVAADAQFHIGLCYEKLGRQEARAAYQEVLTNYPGPQEVVERARARLTALERSEELGQPQAGAGPARTGQMMERLARQRAGVQSYRGTLAITVELMGRTIRSAGPVFFRRPDLMRTELTSSLPTGDNLTVFDGKTSWMYQRVANLVAVIDVAVLASEFPAQDLVNNSALKSFQGLGAESIRYLRTDRIGDEEVYVFQGDGDVLSTRMGLGQAAPDWMEIAVATGDGLIGKSTTRDPRSLRAC